MTVAPTSWMRDGQAIGGEADGKRDGGKTEIAPGGIECRIAGRAGSGAVLMVAGVISADIAKAGMQKAFSAWAIPASAAR